MRGSFKRQQRSVISKVLAMASGVTQTLRPISTSSQTGLMLDGRVLTAGSEVNNVFGAASAEYRMEVFEPDYIAAHLALAGLLSKNGDADGAIRELRDASAGDLQNPSILEQIGDIEAGRGRTAEARTDYQSALNATGDKSVKKRLNGKLKSLAK